MKYKFPFALAILLSCITQLNAQIIVTESFENAFPPAGWSLYTAAGSNPWEVSSTDPAVNGTRCMRQVSMGAGIINAWIFSAPYPLTAGINYKISYWYRNLQSSTVLNFKVTLGPRPVENYQYTTLNNHYNNSVSTYTQGTAIFTVPATSIYYFAFNASSSNQGTLLIDSVVLEQVSGTACTGTPAPVVNGPSTICPDTSFVLSISGANGSGIGYQWQSSPAGVNNFTNIADAISPTYTTSQTVSTDYRCITSCYFSGQSAVSNPLAVSSPAFCYCVPPAMVCTQSHLANVTFAGINNTTGCTAPAGYTDYTTSVAAATVSANTTVPVSVIVGPGTGQKYVTAWIDYNQNGVFEGTERKDLGNGANSATLSSSITIPSIALGGLTRIRFRLRGGGSPSETCQGYSGGAGETEDYAVNIIPFTCSGTPAAGTVTGLSDVCPNTIFTLTMSGSYGSYSLQWESSPMGTNNFSPISGTTSASLTTSQTASTDYRCKVTCAASGLSAYSNIKTVTSPLVCYCPPSNNCTSVYISNVSFGSINNPSSCAVSGDYTSTVSPAVITAGTNTALSVTLNGGSTGQVAAWIDLNRNGVFETTEYTLIGSGANSTVSGPVFIPSNTLPGLTRIRVKWNSGGAVPNNYSCATISTGETEDYSINVLQAPIVFYYTAFADTLYDPVINVTTRIVQKDVGLNVSDSLKPRLWAKRQGTSNWKSFKGQLQSGSSNDGYWVFTVSNDSLGVRRNGCDSIQFYFVAQDLNTPSNLGYFPEVGALHSNVQMQITPPNQLFGYRLKPRLKDTIYVSSSDCRYKSLSNDNGLFQQISLRKLEGNLTIILESDITEDATFELNGADLNNYRVTIRPDGNTLRTMYQNTSYRSMLKLNAVKNVTIDGSYNGAGRFLAISNTVGSPYITDSSSCIQFSNACDSIILKNIVFRHAIYLISPLTAPESGILMKGGGCKHVSILNNLFSNFTAINMSARHITAYAGNDDVIIKNNEFNNFVTAGIIMFGAGQNWIIDSNQFYRTTVPAFYTYDFSGIYVRGGGHVITNNFIGGQAPFCAGGPMNFLDNPSGFIICIRVAGPAGTTPVTISNNRVDNINMSLTFTARASAFGGIGSGNNNSFIFNNIIGNPQSTTPTIVPLAGSIIGISAGGTGFAEIRNNIVTGIINKVGNTPDYYNISITGIGKGNSDGGYYIFSSPGIVTGNHIYNIHNYNNAYSGSDPETPYTRGLSIAAGLNNLIEKNIIHDIWCNENAVAGICYEPGDSLGLTTIQQNRVYDLNNTYAGPGHIHGIYINNVRNSLDIINNQVSITNRNQASQISIRGISETSGVGIYPNAEKRIIYNSFYIGGAATGTAESYVYYFTAINSTLETRTIFNNIFYNERTGGSSEHAAYKFISSSQSQVLNNTMVDYNFYTLRDSLKFVRWGNTTLLNWANWKLNNHFEDSSYISTPYKTLASVFFIAKDSGNLNIDSTKDICWRVNDKGKPFSDIHKDYDAPGIRSTDVLNGRTDIGSDEFTTSTIPPPSIISLCGGGSRNITSNITGTVYQWQADTGTGYTNISNGANYNGTNSTVLQLLNLPASWYGYKYRCIVNGNYSLVSSLKFENIWTGAVSSAWENTANWSCGILPDGNTDIIINSGVVLLSGNGICRTIIVAPGANFTIAAGGTLTITH